jgi:hypothetical protein
MMRTIYIDHLQKWRVRKSLKNAENEWLVQQSDKQNAPLPPF